MSKSVWIGMSVLAAASVTARGASLSSFVQIVGGGTSGIDLRQDKTSNGPALSDSLEMSSASMPWNAKTSVTTDGISLVPWNGHAGQFVSTAPFKMSAQAHIGANTDSHQWTGLLTTSMLTRTATWRIDRLNGGQAAGSFIATYRMSLSGTAEPYRSTYDVTVRDDFSNSAWVNGPVDVNGQVVSGSKTAFESMAPRQMTFGESFDYSYACYVKTQAWNYPETSGGPSLPGNATAKGTAELWNIDVFDEAGHKLKRFVDYDWTEILSAGTDADGNTLYESHPIASAPTLHLGDANFDDHVNFDDLIAVAQNYNGTGKTWTQGDFTQDGTVNFDDLIILAQHYNTTYAANLIDNTSADFAADWALAQSLVPEPMSLGAALCVLATCGTRRRR